MRITLDIDDKILNTVISTTGASSKNKAVGIALWEYIRMKHRQELIQMIGNYNDFILSLEHLENLRNETWKKTCRHDSRSF